MTDGFDFVCDLCILPRRTNHKPSQWVAGEQFMGVFAAMRGRTQSSERKK